MSALRLIAALVLVVVPFGVSHAQSSYIAPSVAIGLAYDDNVFAETDDAQSDLILRLTPTVEAGYRSARGETRLLHSFDAEKYQDNTQLDSFNSRRYTEIDVDWSATQRLDLGVLASTAATKYPGDLLPEFGLELGRTDARRTVVRPDLAYRYTRRTAFTAGGEVARDELVGGRTVDTRGAQVGVAHDWTPRHTWTFDFLRRDYRFRPGGDAYSNVALVGWIGRVSPRSTFTVRGGPRDTEVGTEPELHLAFDYDIPGGDLTFNYERTERVLIGQAGLAEAHAVWLSYTHPITPAIALRIVPSYASLTRGDEDARTGRFYIEAAYRFSPTVQFTSSYQWSRQDGSLDIPGPVDITRNVVFFGMTVAFSPRVGMVPIAEARRRR